MLRFTFSLSVTLMTFTPFLTAAETVSLRADEWCPFTCKAGTPLPGYMIEIASEAFKAKSITVDYDVLNWARALEATREGKFQGVVGATDRDATDFIYPKVSMGIQRSCFYTLPETTWTYKDLSSLENMTLGITKDYTYGKIIDEYIEKNNAKNDGSKAQAKAAPKKGEKPKFDFASGDKPIDMHLKKLTNKRMVVFIEDESVLGNHLKQSQSKVQLKNAGCIEGAPLFIAFGPKNPKAKAYADILDDYVQKARKNGELVKILAKYGLKDWQP